MENIEQNKPQSVFSNKLLLQAIVGAISFLIIFSRRPDALLNPQFWAEDGVVWYAQAYGTGFLSLFNQELGYYCTFQRLVAIVSLWFPFAFVPLIFNLCAIGLKVLVVQFFISTRCSRIVPSLQIRLLLALLYLALPNSWEIDSNLTNTQWHLALLGFLLLIAEPSRRILWKVFDVMFMTVTVLTGPYCFFLFPIAVFRWWQKRESWTLWLLLIIALGCLAEGFSMISHKRLSGAVVGASFDLFPQILGGQVFTSAIIGQNGYWWLINRSIWNQTFATLIAFAGLTLMIYAFTKVSVELKLFIVYSALVFTAALISPAVSATEPQWQIMRLPGACMRYWFLPMMSFLLVLIYFAPRSKTRLLKIAALCLLVLALIGIIVDWRQPPFKDFEFQHYAQEFDGAPSGTQVTIPINPSHEMKLTKR